MANVFESFWDKIKKEAQRAIDRLPWRAAKLEKEAEARRKAEEAKRLEEEAKKKQEEEEARKRKEREEAAKPGPHPAQYRDAANAAGHEYFVNKEQPPIVAPDNPKWGATLWKAQNDSLNGAVLLLDNKTWWDAFEVTKIVGRVAICSDPWGKTVINAGRVSGVGKIVAPYHERPAVRFDGAMGQAWRPGPVFIVISHKNGSRLGVLLLSDPALRTERR